MNNIMDPLSTFQIIGLAITVLFAAGLMCLATYTFNLMWLLMLPCRALYCCCGSMKYSDDDEGVCLCDGKCIV
jgi:hypothetical protein